MPKPKPKETKTSALSGAYSALVTPKRGGLYQVRMPSQGSRVVKVGSQDTAKFLAEAEVLRQKLSTE